MPSRLRHAVAAALLGITLPLLIPAGPVLAAGKNPGAETRARMQRIGKAIEKHVQAAGERPGTTQDLGVVLRLYDTGIPLAGGVPIDAWGSPFAYRSDTDGYVLHSAGENRRDEGGEGDDLVAGEGDAERRIVRRARTFFPMVVLITLGPVAWAAVRHSRRYLR